MRTQFAAALLLAAAGSVSAAEGLAQFAWMQGCWAASDAEAGSGEFWTAPAGGTVLGMSRTIRGGKTVAFEFVQIREVEPGVLAYVVQPSGRPATTFKLKSSTDTEFVFEDLAHDFPQRVMYRRDGDKGIRARIEGMSKGALKGIDFPMQKVECSK